MNIKNLSDRQILYDVLRKKMDVCREIIDRFHMEAQDHPAAVWMEVEEAMEAAAVYEICRQYAKDLENKLSEVFVIKQLLNIIQTVDKPSHKEGVNFFFRKRKEGVTKLYLEALKELRWEQNWKVITVVKNREGL